MNDEELATLIRRSANRYCASERLRAAVRTQVTLHAAALQQPDSAKRPSPWALSLRIAPLGLGFFVGVLVTLALVWTWPRGVLPGAMPDALAGELLSLHVRSMGQGPLFQVASSDRHTVKPWFQGKLDYAPEVPDLQQAGFDLLGGRVDRVQGHDTAVLAYQLRKHIISAYVLPMNQAAPLHRLGQRGFNFVHWSDGVMQVWAVTDADASELDRFASAWQAHH